MQDIPFVILCSILLATVTRSLSPAAKEDMVREKLTCNYSKLSRPEDIVVVELELNLMMINKLNTRSQTLSITGWITAFWRDPNLGWNPGEFHNVTYIMEQKGKLWTPQIVVDNTAGDIKALGNDDMILRINHSGMVVWEIPVSILTHCDIDITYYPFDTQSCVIELTDWIYTQKEIRLVNKSKNINLDDFQANGEWQVLRTEVNQWKTDAMGSTFMELHFKMVVRRRALFYTLNIILPLMLISVLCVMAFLIPVDAGEKVSYSITVLLSYAVLLTMVSNNMPATSKHVAVLELYLVTIMFIGTVSVILTIIILQLYHRADDEEIPTWLQRLATGFSSQVSSHGGRHGVECEGWSRAPTSEDCGRVEGWSQRASAKDGAGRHLKGASMLRSPNRRERKKESNPTEEPEQKIEQFDSWKSIANVLDKFFFRLLLFVVLLTNLILIIVLSAFSEAPSPSSEAPR